MKIYFAGSIKGGREDGDLYSKIIEILGKYGTVLTEHLGDKELSEFGEKNLTEEYIYKRDMKWLREADVFVAEVTTPSSGVGYEIGRCEALKKPTLCLFRETSGKGLSAMIAGNSNIRVEKYKDLKDITGILENFFKELK